jgi:hypothetical protein
MIRRLDRIAITGPGVPSQFGLHFAKVKAPQERRRKYLWWLATTVARISKTPIGLQGRFRRRPSTLGAGQRHGASACSHYYEGSEG